MSNVTTTPQGQKAVAKTAMQWLTDDKFKQSIMAVLPKHLTAERMTRIALSELRINPKLTHCNPLSFISAIVQASQLGLEPGVLGKCYLIPYGQNVQFIVGYRGMLELARRSGEIQSVLAAEVCENDTFSYEMGLKPNIIHKPAMGERGKAIAFYSVAQFKDGGHQFEVMSVKEIEDVRKSSKAANSGPWMTHYNEMAKKTVLRRLFKWLPVSIELQTAVALDEQADLGLQNNELLMDNSIIDMEAMNISNETPASESVSGDGEVLPGPGKKSVETTQAAQAIIEKLSV